MNTIHKCPIKIKDIQTVSFSSDILYVGMSPRGGICIWSKVTPECPEVEQTVYIVGTGQEIPKEATKHIGTVIIDVYVYHVFI